MSFAIILTVAVLLVGVSNVFAETWTVESQTDWENGNFSSLLTSNGDLRLGDMIEGFESGNIDNYSGDADGFDVNSNNVFSNTYSLEANNNNVDILADTNEVVNELGNTDNFSKIVSVRGTGVTARIENITALLAGNVSKFSGKESTTTGTIDNYRWDFDTDGTVDNTGKIAGNVFEEVGETTVSLTVEDNYGFSDTVENTFTINGVEIVNISASETVIDRDPETSDSVEKTQISIRFDNQNYKVSAENFAGKIYDSQNDYLTTVQGDYVEGDTAYLKVYNPSDSLSDDSLGTFDVEGDYDDWKDNFFYTVENVFEVNDLNIDLDLTPNNSDMGFAYNFDVNFDWFISKVVENKCWTSGVTRTYDAGFKENVELAPGRYEIKVYGASGEQTDSTGTVAGKGGYVEGELVVSEGKDLEIWVADGRHGRHDGGLGGTYEGEEEGGSGGGSTELYLKDNMVAIADGGGGTANSGAIWAYGGGGGARGGEGGGSESGFDDGEDAEGSGYGGDGGYGNEDGPDGPPENGGGESGAVLENVIIDNGGSTTGHYGKVEVKPLEIYTEYSSNLTTDEIGSKLFEGLENYDYSYTIEADPGSNISVNITASDGNLDDKVSIGYVVNENHYYLLKSLYEQTFDPVPEENIENKEAIIFFPDDKTTQTITSQEEEIVVKDKPKEIRVKDTQINYYRTYAPQKIKENINAYWIHPDKYEDVEQYSLYLDDELDVWGSPEGRIKITKIHDEKHKELVHRYWPADEVVSPYLVYGDRYNIRLTHPDYDGDYDYGFIEADQSWEKTITVTKPIQDISSSMYFNDYVYMESYRENKHIIVFKYRDEMDATENVKFEVINYDNEQVEYNSGILTRNEHTTRWLNAEPDVPYLVRAEVNHENFGYTESEMIVPIDEQFITEDSDLYYDGDHMDDLNFPIGLHQMFSLFVVGVALMGFTSKYGSIGMLATSGLVAFLNLFPVLDLPWSLVSFLVVLSVLWMAGDTR